MTQIIGTAAAIFLGTLPLLLVAMLTLVELKGTRAEMGAK